MTITILTLVPEMFERIISTSILGRAQKKGLVKIRLVNLRDFAIDKRGTVDDRPYGGGVGMLLRVDVVEKAITKFKIQNSKFKSNSKFKNKERIVNLDPGGKMFTQAKARKYTKLDHLMLICGHYEGIDSRIVNFVDESLTIGKYVLTGGELPAMVVTDAIIRLIPGVLEKNKATLDESYTNSGELEALQYTRPPVYKGLKVPQVLLLGNHQEIAKWRKASSLNRGK
ncbi:tRNA (guanosine(37)-N1)-methyltransferase TrmD [Candidatus Microgenomates bacterium]|nr:tRNA (guanosine(37)-N1)-methyltransferase TrmD [Candidatus Microgenomates bacterium]